MAFLWRKVIHDDHIARAQCRAQDLADIGLEHFCIGGAVDGHASRRAVPPDGTDHSGRLPVAAGCAGVNPLPTGGASTQPTHVGLGSRFIQEDQFGRVEPRLLASPRTSRSRNVRAVLFAGAECLFLYVSPSLAKT
jgi:hypothetical protein